MGFFSRVVKPRCDRTRPRRCRSSVGSIARGGKVGRRSSAGGVRSSSPKPTCMQMSRHSCRDQYPGSGLVVASPHSGTCWHSSVPTVRRSVAPAVLIHALFASVTHLRLRRGSHVLLTRIQADAARPRRQEAALRRPPGLPIPSRAGTNFRRLVLEIPHQPLLLQAPAGEAPARDLGSDGTPDLYLYARAGQAGFPPMGPIRGNPLDKLAPSGSRRPSTGYRRSTGWSDPPTSGRT